MSGKTVFRNIMSILSPGVNSIISERTSQLYGNLLEKAVHLSLEIIILVLEKDLQLADFWRPLYQVLIICLTKQLHHQNRFFFFCGFVPCITYAKSFVYLLALPSCELVFLTQSRA